MTAIQTMMEAKKCMVRTSPKEMPETFNKKYIYNKDYSII
jgi:hypothetical protein